MSVERNHLTVEQMEQLLGDQVRRARIALSIDQATLAERANISVRAVSNLERGQGSSIRSLVAVLRALGRVDWLGTLAPQVGVSPMQLLRSKQRTPQPRRRVGRAREARG